LVIRQVKEILWEGGGLGLIGLKEKRGDL